MLKTIDLKENMRKIIEIIQTWCHVDVVDDRHNQKYHVKAEVVLEQAIGRRLKIGLEPALNGITSDTLIYDGSKLPEDMVREWLLKELGDKSFYYSLKLTASDKKKIETEIEN